MKKTVFLSFFSFLGIYSYDPKECLLDPAKFMAFLVRVSSKELVTDPDGVVTTRYLAIGSIITPDSVLTLCSNLSGRISSDLQINTVQAKYEKLDRPPPSLGYGEYFQTTGSAIDNGGCNQTRGVRTIFRHPQCPKEGVDYNEYDQSPLLYNIALLRTNEPFRNLTQAVPVLPYVPELAVQLEFIDRFNSIRRERALFPALYPYQHFVRYLPIFAARALPYVTECRQLICGKYALTAQYPICMESLTNQTGYVLCVRRVKQSNKGIAWIDNFARDVDIMNEDKFEACQGSICEPNAFRCGINGQLGMPIISRGAAIGIVTGCHPWGYTATSIFAIRLFVNKITEEYTQNIVFMDNSTSAPKPPGRFSYQGERKEAGIPYYSTSNLVQQGILVYVGLAIIALN